MSTEGVRVSTEQARTTHTRPALFLGVLLSLTSLHAQRQPRRAPTEALEELSSSVQNVVTKVAPAIVRIEVVGYSRADDDDDEERLGNPPRIEAREHRVRDNTGLEWLHCYKRACSGRRPAGAGYARRRSHAVRDQVAPNTTRYTL